MSRSFRAVFGVFFTVATFTAPCRGQDSPDYGRRVDAGERLKILEMLSDKMRQNYEGIKTWGGVYEATNRTFFFGTNPSSAWVQTGEPLDRGRIPVGADGATGYWIIRKAHVRFDVDTAEKKCHVFSSAIESDGILDPLTGTEVRSTLPLEFRHELVTRDYGLRMEVSHAKGKFPEFAKVDPISRGRVVVRCRPENMSRNSLMFDPRDFFTTSSFRPNGRRLTWKSFDRYLQVLRGELSNNFFDDLVQQKLAVYVSADEPPVYTVVLPYGGGNYTYCFDGKAGFNLVLYRQSGGPPDRWENIYSTTYRGVSGTFIPDTIERQQTHFDKNEKPHLGGFYSYKLRSTELNQPIPSSEFEVTSFGLNYGDRMHDQNEQKLYVYDDQKGFVAAEEFEFDKSRVKDAITK